MSYMFYSKDTKTRYEMKYGLYNMKYRNRELQQI